jgi:hypothetical protein
VAVGVGRQAQALLARAMLSPEQSWRAYEGSADRAEILSFRRPEQNCCDSSRRPGMLVARSERRQLSALQTGVSGHFLEVSLTTKAPRSMVLTKT